MSATNHRQVIPVHFKCSAGNKYKILVLCFDSNQSHKRQRELPKIDVVSNNNGLKISVNALVVFLGKVEHAPEIIDLERYGFNSFNREVNRAR